MSYGCEPEYISSTSKLRFSTDTLLLDTIIVGLGTETSNLLRLYNKGNENVNNIRLSLAGGNESPFLINVSGRKGSSFTNLQLSKNDSLYVFVQAKINPSNLNDIFYPVMDSIIVESGENRIVSVLRVVVINANYVSGTIGDVTWEKNAQIYLDKDLTVAANSTLTIKEGCRVYLNNNVKLIVEGSIKAMGTKENPILFGGARQGLLAGVFNYQQVSGVWNQIWLKNTSKDNTFSYCTISNAKIGIVVGEEAKEGKVDLTLRNSTLTYNGVADILSYNGQLLISNCLLSNSEQQLIAIGGKLEVIQTTIANYFEWRNSTTYTKPSVVLSNYNYLNDKDKSTYNLESALFYNSIITGNSSNEILLQTLENTSISPKFKYCLLKQADEKDDEHYTHIIYSKSPLFVSTTYFEYDFELTDKSPCMNTGGLDYIGQYPNDIEDIVRDGKPDIGAYEYVLKK